MHLQDYDPGHCEGCGAAHSTEEWRQLGGLCPRCGQHTGNNTQGHWWRLCKVWLAEGRGLQGSVRDFHFCCPGNCELTVAPRPPADRDPHQMIDG